MNKILLSTLAALALTATTALAATPQTVTPTVASDGNGMEYNQLYTESSWLAIEVPRAALANTSASDLALDVSGLPAGVSITLDSVAYMGDRALLYVTVSRDTTANYVNALATINVKAGSDVLSSVSIPVIGAATNIDGE